MHNETIIPYLCMVIEEYRERSWIFMLLKPLQVISKLYFGKYLIVICTYVIKISINMYFYFMFNNQWPTMNNCVVVVMSHFCMYHICSIMFVECTNMYVYTRLLLQMKIDEFQWTKIYILRIESVRRLLLAHIGLNMNINPYKLIISACTTTL